MPVRSHTRHEFPRKPPKSKPMFAKSDSGAKPHQGLLSDALRVNPQPASHKKTKTLSR